MRCNFSHTKLCLFTWMTSQRWYLLSSPNQTWCVLWRKLHNFSWDDYIKNTLNDAYTSRCNQKRNQGHLSLSDGAPCCNSQRLGVIAYYHKNTHPRLLKGSGSASGNDNVQTCLRHVQTSQVIDQTVLSFNRLLDSLNINISGRKQSRSHIFTCR